MNAIATAVTPVPAPPLPVFVDPDGQTLSQPFKALNRANCHRLTRFACMRAIAAGTLTVPYVLHNLSDIPALHTMKIGALIETQHRWGMARTRKLLAQIPVSESRQLRGLTDRQIDSITANLQHIQRATIAQRTYEARWRRARNHQEATMMQVPQEATTVTPERSFEQRMEALAHGNAIRLKRAALKRDIKSGKRSVSGVLADPPEFALTMKAGELLVATPKVGKVKCDKILDRLRISPRKTIGGLSERQRRELIATLPLP